MSPGERASVDRERLFNKALDAEVSAVEAIQGVIDMGLGNSGIAPDMWRRLQEALQSEAAALSGARLLAFADGQWERQNDRVEFKRLWNDGAVLIRCEPGGSEEPHDQPVDQVEHIIVIAGDLRIGGRVFETGDYLSVPAGTVHPRMSSEGGCILFTAYDQAGDQ